MTRLLTFLIFLLTLPAVAQQVEPTPGEVAARAAGEGCWVVAVQRVTSPGGKGTKWIALYDTTICSPAQIEAGNKALDASNPEGWCDRNPAACGR